MTDGRHTPTSPAQARGNMLVHCLWFSGSRRSLEARRARFHAARQALGLASYEMVEPRRRALACWALRQARGTAPAPDAVEIMYLSAHAPHVREVIDHWSKTAGCELDGLAVERSFFLSGEPRRRLTAPGGLFRIHWFGRGLASLSDDQFASHYVDVHGQLVERHASLIGLRRYTQLRAAFDDERQALLAAGLGRAAPTVFAELVLGFGADALHQRSMRRRAVEEIAADERRHIDFARSMILLA